MSKPEIVSNERKKPSDVLKEEYSKRINELDNFSKRILNMYGQINAEIFYGSLNNFQHSLDLQDKLSHQYGLMGFPGFTNGTISQNTKLWIDYLQNVDAKYIESLKNLKNLIRMINSSVIFGIKSLESGLEISGNNDSKIKKENNSKLFPKNSPSVKEKNKN